MDLTARTRSSISEIAADEPKRVKDDIYPLFEWGITEEQALKYCYKHGFDWGGCTKSARASLVGSARCKACEI